MANALLKQTFTRLTNSFIAVGPRSRRPTTLMLALPLVLGTACSGGPPKDQERPSPGEVWLSPRQVEEAKITTAPVGYSGIGGELTVPGRIAFDDRRVAHVSSPVTGRVTALLAALGQRVRKGDSLAVIQSPDLGSAFSDYAKAEAAFAASERDYERQKELFAVRAVAQKDLEASETTYQQATAELQRAQQKARLLKAKGGDAVTQEYVLPSPIDGEVIARNVNPGTEVQGQYSGGGTSVEVFTIGKMDKVWVLADVYEVDLGRVRMGAPVTARVVSEPDRVHRGQVDWISGAIDPTTRTARIRCVLDNPEGALKPEMYATVGIGVEGKKEIAVPRSAVVRMGDQTVVFVQVGRTASGLERFETRPVRTDDEGSGSDVPVAGVRPGERVVTAGTILLAGKT
jgi:membrane fusion protein, heavy metal efflux system